MGRVKQVILIRRDLKMRRGKEIAQGSHAAMDFIVKRILASLAAHSTKQVELSLSEDEIKWLTEGMAKVCLQINSEEELLKYHQKALDAGLPSHLILDSGRTEFGGQPTLTACAIGPAKTDLLDAVTGELSLY